MHRGGGAASFVVGGVAPAHPVVPVPQRPFPRSAFRPRRTDGSQDGASVPSRDVSSAAIPRLARAHKSSRHRRHDARDRAETGTRGIDAPGALRRCEATRAGRAPRVNPRDTM